MKEPLTVASLVMFSIAVMLEEHGYGGYEMTTEVERWMAKGETCKSGPHIMDEKGVMCGGCKTLWVSITRLDEVLRGRSDEEIVNLAVRNGQEAVRQEERWKGALPDTQHP